MAGGVITAVGQLPADAQAASVVDASGLVLAPGFIDVHTHSDVTLLHGAAGVNKVCQGVTTEMTGNCGFSAFPIAPRHRGLHNDHLAYLGPDVADLAWVDFDGYAHVVEAAHPIQNVACLAGHGTLRIAVAGTADGPLRPEQENSICAELERALEQGAFGFSTGLTYVPSMFGSPAEIALLGGVAARYGSVYATHARGVAGQERDAIEEAVEVGRRSGVRVEFSHLAINDPRSWGSAQASLALFDDAARAGIDIKFDVYPYDASASSIAQYLPTWLTTGGPVAARQLLSEPATRRRALAEMAGGWFGGIPWLWDRVLVTQAGPGDSGSPGHTVEQLSASWGCDPGEAVLRLFETHGNALQVAMFYRTEEDMVEFLRHPASIIGSDGVAMAEASLSEKPTRAFTALSPGYLGVMSARRPSWAWKTRCARCRASPPTGSASPVAAMSRPGFAADIVLFSADGVADRATFVEPNRLPVGIDKVFVNGSLVVEHGSWNGTSAGRVLRRGQN